MPPGAENVRSKWLVWAIAFWIGAILVLCLRPTRNFSPGVVELCLICGEFGAGNFVLNAVLYAPLGFLICLRKNPVWASVLVGLILAVAVEATQLWIPGRFTALGDVFANSVGALVGGLLASPPRFWLAPARNLGLVLTTIWSLGASATIAATGHLLSPSVPVGSLFGNWTPRLPTMEPYRGRVISATVEGLPLPSRRLPNTERVHALLEAGAPLSVHFELGQAPAAPAPLFRLIGSELREAVRIDVEDSDLVFTPRYVATDVRLSRPGLRFAEVLISLSPGDLVTVTLEPRGSGGYQLWFQGEPHSASGVTPARGWILFGNLDGLATRLGQLMDLLWVSALLFPVGWWAPTGAALVLGGAGPISALILIPLVTPLMAPSLLHILVATASLLAGYAAGWKMGSRRRARLVSGGS